MHPLSNTDSRRPEVVENPPTPPSCCYRGFEWQDKPAGRVEKLEATQAYVTGNSSAAAVLIVHDLLGWAFPNIRLLADHYARKAGCTVFVPDFFGGEALPADLINAGKWDELNLDKFLADNARHVREPEILACARALRRS